MASALREAHMREKCVSLLCLLEETPISFLDSSRVVLSHLALRNAQNVKTYVGCTPSVA